MNPAPPTTRLATSANAIVVQLKADPGLVGLTSNTLTLANEDRSIVLKTPTAAFPNIKAEGGDLLVCSVTLLLTRVEAIDPFEAGLMLGKMDS